MPELICCFIAEAVLPNSVKELSLRVWTGASAFNERYIYIDSVNESVIWRNSIFLYLLTVDL